MLTPLTGVCEEGGCKKLTSFGFPCFLCSSSLLDYVLFACVYFCHPGVCQTAPIVDTKAFFDAIGRDIGKKLEKHDVSWKQLFTFKSDDWEELGLACKDRK
jgi:hypothetical protein